MVFFLNLLFNDLKFLFSFVVLIALIVYGFYEVIYKIFIKRLIVPLIIIDAKLIEKQSGIISGGRGGLSPLYTLEFETVEGERILFYVRANEWMLPQKGNIGKLYYKSDRYKGFELESVSEKE